MQQAMSALCIRFAKGLLWEFHYSRFYVTYNSWRAFAFTPWLPHTLFFQTSYLVYRCIVFSFLLTSLFMLGFEFSALNRSSDHHSFFSYPTYWMIIQFTVYSMWAIVSVSIVYFSAFVCKKEKFQDPDQGGPCNRELLIDDRPQGCCGCDNDKTEWHQKMLWTQATVSVHTAFFMAGLYWFNLYRPFGTDWSYYGNLAAHALVPLVGLAEVLLTGIPWRLLHVIYTFLFGVFWIAFSAFNLAIGTGDRNSPMGFIYPVLSYMQTPTRSSEITLAIFFIGTPLVHVVIYVVRLLRDLLVCLVAKAFNGCRKVRVADSNHNEGTELLSTSNHK